MTTWILVIAISYGVTQIGYTTYDYCKAAIADAKNSPHVRDAFCIKKR